MVPRRAAFRRARAHLARGAYLIAALLLLLGIARSGALYFYCPFMNATFDASCCTAKHDPPRRETPSFDVGECCKMQRMGTLPAAAAVGSIAVFAAPLAAVLPPFDLASPGGASRIVARAGHPARDGPRPSVPSRATLMIWNC